MNYRCIDRKELIEKAISYGILYSLKRDIANTTDDKTKEYLLEIKEHLDSIGLNEDEVYRFIQDIDGKECLSYITKDMFISLVDDKEGYELIQNEISELQENKEY